MTESGSHHAKEGQTSQDQENIPLTSPQAAPSWSPIHPLVYNNITTIVNRTATPAAIVPHTAPQPQPQPPPLILPTSAGRHRSGRGRRVTSSTLYKEESKTLMFTAIPALLLYPPRDGVVFTFTNILHYEYHDYDHLPLRISRLRISRSRISRLRLSRDAIHYT